MAKRRSWSRLGERQKKRYLGAGASGKLTGEPLLTATGRPDRQAVRRYYEAGGSLLGGRGYHPPAGAAPTAATGRATRGEATDADRKALARWRRRTSPGWLPKDRSVMGDDTAASLSRIGSHPRNWKSVDVQPRPDGSFTVVVVTKRGATRLVILPDRSSLAEFALLLRHPVEQGRTRGERKRLAAEWRKNGDPLPIAFTVGAYDQPLLEEDERELRPEGRAFG